MIQLERIQLEKRGNRDIQDSGISLLELSAISYRRLRAPESGLRHDYYP